MKYFALLFFAILLFGLGLSIHSCSSSSTTSPGNTTAQLEATITGPTDGQQLTQDQLADFSGFARFAGGVEIDAANIYWTSNKDGVFGQGNAFRRSGLSLGSHTLSLIAATDDGDSVATSVNITVNPAANAMNVTISAPAGATISQHDLFALSGKATDENGNKIIDLQKMVWRSDIDGILGNGAQIRPGGLTPGQHLITFEAAGSAATGSAGIVITSEFVQPQGINLVIMEPANGATLPAQSDITFSGTATDANGNPITPDQLIWTSSRDIQQPIGIGEACIVPNMAKGVHRVTFRASDDNGNNSVSILINIDDLD